MSQMMNGENDVLSFMAAYPSTVQSIALELRLLILSSMPGIGEIVDRPARIIGYGFGAGYRDMVCTIILSKTGVKLGIVQGVELTDVTGLLQGTGKRHRYVLLTKMSDLDQPGLKPLLEAALAAWQVRSKRSGQLL